MRLVTGKYIYDLMKIKLDRFYFSIADKLVCGITFLVGHWERYGGTEGGITLTNMKKGEFSDFEVFLYFHYHSAESFAEQYKYGDKIIFDKPCVLRAQSSLQRGKGCTCGGAIPYGDTEHYSIIGIEITMPYALLSESKRKKGKSIKLTF